MIRKRVSLQSLNTFGFDIEAMLYAEFQCIDELESLWKTNLLVQSSPLILGGGSNILFTQDYSGLVLRNCIRGMNVIEETAADVIIELGSGESWHDCVLWAVANGWGGIENLSLIPGTAGAAPIQNIGAYGAELEQVFLSLAAFDLYTGKVVTLQHNECEFGYRDSIFKRHAKGRFIITSVRLKLSKQPVLKLDYGDIRNVLDENRITNPTIKDVSEAVISIRKSKLPDPAEIGNCGSFFKNPVIDKDLFTRLLEANPGIKYFESGNQIKVPAAWLIEQCGWKGYRNENYGVHVRQALVLVNYGGASGADIRKLAGEIQDSVEEHFGIRLEMEVNVV